MKSVATAIISALILTGCATTAPPPSTGSLSGNWQILLSSASSSGAETGFIIQSGNSVSGNVLSSGQVISGQATCGAVGSVQGQLNNTDVTITITLPGQSLNLTGKTAANSGTMGGKYSLLAAGCGQTDTGTWSGSRINTLSGGFRATFTSSALTSPFHFSGTIKQAANSGQSTAALSGSMNSNDSPCFTNAAIAGVVTGTSVTINILASDGEAYGKLSGVMSPDAGLINGSFVLSNASDPALLQTCQGVGGNATVSVQLSPT